MRTEQPQAIQYNRAKTWQIGLFTLNNTATNTALFMMGYYAYFTQNVLGLMAVVVGGIATAMRIFDGITDPIIGFILDKTNTRFGRFRPFMLVGNLIMCACILGIFNTPVTFSISGKYTYTTILYVLYTMGYTCQTTVTKAAQSVLTNDPGQRPVYSGFDAIFTRLSGAFISVLLTNVLADKYSVGEYADNAGMINPALWRMAGLIICGAMFIMTLLAILGIAGKDKPEFYLRAVKQKVRFRDYWNILKTNRPIQMLIIAAATDKLGTLLQNGVLIYLFANLFLNARLQGTYTVATMLPLILSALAGVFNSRRVGLRKNFLFGTWGSMLLLAVMFVMRPNPAAPWLWLGINIVQSCLASMANSSVVPMLADCTDYEHYNSGRFVPGMIGTMFSFVDKLISSLSGLVVGVALALAGVGNSVIAPNQPVTGRFDMAILCCYCIVPILGHVASIISMKFYKLDKARMEEIQLALSKSS